MADSEKYLSGETVYTGPIFSVEQAQVQLADGQSVQRDIVHHVPAVAIIAFLDADHIILEKQWRTPVQDFVLEIPAGKLDERDQGDAAHAVVRELNEELRMTAGQIMPVMDFYETVGFSDAAMTIYLARDLQPVVSDQILPRDDGESLDLLTVSFDQLQDWFNQGKLKDQKTLTAFFYWAYLRR